jgi:hypothetical protein
MTCVRSGHTFLPHGHAFGRAIPSSRTAKRSVGPSLPRAWPCARSGRTPHLPHGHAFDGCTPPSRMTCVRSGLAPLSRMTCARQYSPVFTSPHQYSPVLTLQPSSSGRSLGDSHPHARRSDRPALGGQSLTRPPGRNKIKNIIKNINGFDNKNKIYIPSLAPRSGYTRRRLGQFRSRDYLALMTVANHPTPSSTVPHHSVPTKTIQYHPTPPNATQHHRAAEWLHPQAPRSVSLPWLSCHYDRGYLIPSNTIQHHPIPSRTIQYHPVPSHTIQHHRAAEWLHPQAPRSVPLPWLSCHHGRGYLSWLSLQPRLPL